MWTDNSYKIYAKIQTDVQPPSYELRNAGEMDYFTTSEIVYHLNG